MSPGISRDKEQTQAPVADQLDSRQQPAWHVVVLGLFTMSLYLPYWGFKTWRDLQRESIEVNGYPEDTAAQAAGVAPPTLPPVPERKGNLHLDAHTRETLQTFARVSPGLRAIGLLVPIIQIYLMATLTIGIANLVPDEKSFPRRKPLVATLLIVGGFLGSLSLVHLPGALFLVSTLAMLPLALLQHWLNQYWRSVEADELLVRHGFNLWEMIAIIVGAMLQGIVVAGLMMGIKN